MPTLTTPTSTPGWSPDVVAFAPADAVPDALLLSTATFSGEVDGDRPVVRVTFVRDDDADFVDEGAVIPEADPQLDEVDVATAKVAKLVAVSREQYSQQQASGRLATAVRRAIVTRANEAYLTQAAPASGVTPPTGLLNLPGLTEAVAPVVGDLDPVIDLIAALQDVKGTPSAIVVAPTGWAALRKMKDEDGSARSLLGAGTTDAVRMLLDVPVLVSAAMAPDAGLVLDASAIAGAWGPVQVATSEHVFFTSDSVAIRATWRIGWNLVHPERIGRFTIGAPTP